MPVLSMNLKFIFRNYCYDLAASNDFDHCAMAKYHQSLTICQEPSETVSGEFTEFPLIEGIRKLKS
jgi:hypothetical protein